MTEALVLFAGAADGWGIGLKRAGIQPIALAESEPERRAALRSHHPEAVIYDDVRHVTRARLLADLGRLPTVVVGSPPCQGISAANPNAKGVEDGRSALYFDAVRIVGEVRPDWFSFENSDRLRTRGYDRIKAALVEVGYASWPSVVEAGSAGHRHCRPRSWVSGVPGDLSFSLAPDAHQAQRTDGSLVGGLRASEESFAGCIGGSVPEGVRALDDAIGARGGLARHYRMADGLPAGLARLCIASYGDALVPDIAFVFARVMPQLVAELRGGQL